MKCIKCGANLENGLTSCPYCGKVLSAQEASEGIQNEIGSKIDMILEDSEENFRGLDDGVEMRSGHLDAVVKPDISNSQDFKAADTVFEKMSEDELEAARARSERARADIKDQYHWDNSEWEDLDDEAMLEKLVNDDTSHESGSRSQGKAASGFSAQETSGRRVSGESTARTDNKQKGPKPAAKSTAAIPAAKSTAKQAGTQRSSRSDNSSARRPAPKRKPRVREAKQAPGRSHPGLVIAIILIILVAAAVGVILYTGIYENWIFWRNDEPERTTVADTLVCNIQEGGVYSLPLEITVESTAGNRIYYTLDGSEPSNTSLKYNGSIVISNDYVTWTEAPYTLKVVTYTETSIKAADLTVNFVVKKPDIAAPVFSLPGGTYVSAQGITISAEQGATIYYTYDEWGTIPTTESWVYRGTIEMLGGTRILSAIAVNGDRISEVAQVTYTLSLAINYSYEDAYNMIANKVFNEGYAVSATEPEIVTTPETTTAAPAPTKPGETTTPTTTAPPPETEAPRITTAVLFNSGTVEIDGVTYYIIWVQLYYKTGERANGMYYGVDSSSGAIVRLANNGGYYSIIY